MGRHVWDMPDMFIQEMSWFKFVAVYLVCLPRFLMAIRACCLMERKLSIEGVELARK